MLTKNPKNRALSTLPRGSPLSTKQMSRLQRTPRLARVVLVDMVCPCHASKKGRSAGETPTAGMVTPLVTTASAKEHGCSCEAWQRLAVTDLDQLQGIGLVPHRLYGQLMRGL